MPRRSVTAALAAALLSAFVLAAAIAAPAAVRAAPGCTEVIVPPSVAPNTPVATVLGLIQGDFNVSGVFRWNNASKKFDALYFSTAGAPVDASTVNARDPIFICGSGNGSFPTGAY
jgi:hypothetical protein